MSDTTTPTFWGVAYTERDGSEQLLGHPYRQRREAEADLARRHEYAKTDPHHVGAKTHLVTVTIAAVSA